MFKYADGMENCSLKFKIEHNGAGDHHNCIHIPMLTNIMNMLTTVLTCLLIMIVIYRE